MSNKVTFYININPEKKIEIIYKLIKKIYNEQLNSLIILPSINEVEDFDKFLWTYEDSSFLAHNIVDINEINNYSNIPIIIAKFESLYDFNLDNKKIIIFNLTDNVFPKIENRILHFYDINNTNLAREHYKIYKIENKEIEYFDMESKNK